MKKLLIAALTAMLFIGAAPQNQENLENIWYRPGVDEDSQSSVIYKLDMSKGFAIADQNGILIIVLDAETGEQVAILFPNGGFWSAEILSPGQQEFLPKEEKKFQDKKNYNNLDEYLKNLGPGIEIKRAY